MKFIDNLILAQYGENVPYALEKNASSTVAGCNTLHIYPLGRESSLCSPDILYPCLFLSACFSNYWDGSV